MQPIEWDFCYEADGRRFKTRPARLGDLAALDDFANGREVRLSLVMERVQGMFIGEDRPLVLEWEIADLGRFFSQLRDYVAAVKKKQEKAMKAIKAASRSTPGS